MKHLKLFEGYLDNYYSEVNAGAEFDADVRKIVSMERKYIDKLAKLDFKIQKNAFYYADRENNGFYWAHKDTPYGFIDIYQIEDDYFIVRIFRIGTKPDEINKFSNFKCDQFEGLLKLLKDKNL